MSLRSSNKLKDLILYSAQLCLRAYNTGILAFHVWYSINTTFTIQEYFHVYNTGILPCMVHHYFHITIREYFHVYNTGILHVKNRGINLCIQDSNISTIQCFGSASFWCRSGSADPLWWIVDPDPTYDRTNSNFYMICKELKEVEETLRSKCLTWIYKTQVILHEL